LTFHCLEAIDLSHSCLVTQHVFLSRRLPIRVLRSYDSDYDSYGGYGYGGGHYGWGPDRRGWAEKSEAALERERFADAAFDRFWDKCSKMPVDSTAFPVTEEINK